MIGLDTNVLLRLVDGTNAAQTRQASALISTRGDRSCFVGVIVLCEFAWTLKQRYKLKRSAVADHLASLMSAREFIVQNEAEVIRAVDSFRTGKADFADYLLAEINRSLGCSTTMTFDKDAAINDLMTLVPG